MIFLFNTPVLAGFGNYLIPLQIGSRDMAFPRLNAFSYWIFLFAGLFLLLERRRRPPARRRLVRLRPAHRRSRTRPASTSTSGASASSSSASPPPSARSTSSSRIFKLRAPGMTFNRMPIFVWSMLVFSFMVIFAVPAVTIAAALLELDRLFGTAFYTSPRRRQRAALPAPVLVLGPSRGVHPVRPRHRHGLDDHPGVLTPAPRGLRVGRHRARGGRRSSASACGCTTCSPPGSPPLALSFFSAVSLIITIPSGVQFFAWIATMWKGKVRSRPSDAVHRSASC